MNNYPQSVTYKGLDIGPKGYPSAYGLTALDPDVSSWQKRVKNYSGESVSDFVLSCINIFVKDLKVNNLWNHLLEIYIFSGVTRESIPVKLKYLPNRPSNLTVPSGWTTYNATGTGAGLSNLGSSYQITTGVLTSDLPARNRSVGAYCTSNTSNGSNPFYATIIGRGAGGSNSGFGPTPTVTGQLYSRFLDTAINGTISTSQTGTAGLYISSEGRGTIKQYSQQRITNVTAQMGEPQTVSGATSGYIIGGGGSAGNYMWATVSFGYLGLALNDIQLTLLDKIVNRMMTSFNCNVY